MTREEAKQRLIDLQDGSGQTYEAIRIAIEALSTEAEWIPCKTDLAIVHDVERREPHRE